MINLDLRKELEWQIGTNTQGWYRGVYIYIYNYPPPFIENRSFPRRIEENKFIFNKGESLLFDLLCIKLKNIDLWDVK